MTYTQFVEMIRDKKYPDSVNQFYRDWLGMLYSRGKVQQAVRMLQSLIECDKRERALL